MRRLRGPHAPVVGRAGELVQGHRAPQVHVRVVLPREADAAERLHAVLGVRERGVERQARPRRRSRDRGPGLGRASSAARAASHTAARASSMRASISAQRCFTPWNCPIGRPNCTRTFAYSAAVSTHHCAMPIASAANNTAAIARTRSAVDVRQPAVGRRRRRRRCVASRRVRSTLATSVACDVGRVERVPRAVDLAHDHVGDVPRRSRASAVERDRADERTAHSRRRAVPWPRSAVEREQRGDDRGRHVRARRARPAQLLDDDGLFEQPARRRRAGRSSPARRARPRTAGRVSVSASSAARVTGGRDAGVDEAANALAQCSCSSVIPIGIQRASRGPPADGRFPSVRPASRRRASP